MANTVIKKVCLITPSHISSNPRLVKEAMALENAGFAIHLIFTQNLKYLKEFDFQILSKNPNWTFDVLDLSPVGFINKTRNYKKAILQKIINLSLWVFPTLKASKLLINRHFHWQKKKAVHSKANLYIAHNIGALPVAFEAAYITNAKCGFDAEDFHRGQRNNRLTTKNIKIVENYYLPKVDYITAASPLIAKEYEQLFKRKPIVTLNVFPKTNQCTNINENQVLKLFWFSQTIGPNRGLENKMIALKAINFDFEFHLLGNVSTSYKNLLLSLLPKEKQHCIFFHAPISPYEIDQLCVQFDIGIASEPGFSINNNIALSNKIFTYLQNGLAILASNTTAQADFINAHPHIGVLYKKNDPVSLEAVLNNYNVNRDLLRMHQKNSYDLGQNVLNWEIEQKKVVKLIQDVISY